MDLRYGATAAFHVFPPRKRAASLDRTLGAWTPRAFCRLGSSVLIYECPPLSARIALRQCVHNRRTVKAAKGMGPTANVSQRHNKAKHRDPAITRILLRCCMTCPGVKALVSKGDTDPPVEWKR